MLPALTLLLLPACTAVPRQDPGDSVDSLVQEGERIGSAEGARVAVPPEEERPLLFLAGPGADLALLEQAAPGVEIRMPANRAQALELAPRAHGADARWVDASFLEAASSLAWIQVPWAGVDRFLRTPGLEHRPDLVITNMKGMHGPAIADHVFALILAQARRLRQLERARTEGRWDRSAAAGAWSLEGRTLLVAGLGGIGTEVARRGHGFGMRVLATRRSRAEGPDFVERVERAPALPELLPEADILVLAVPLTEETRGLIGARELDLLPDHALVVNIGRGALLDTGALVEALEEGRLGGACLDVTDPEPLPPEHPLWQREDVWITPHVAGVAELTRRRQRALLAANLRRFGAGRPLLNVVDPARGY